MSTKTETPTHKTCAGKCGRNRRVADFYSTTDLDFFPDGKIHICKICVSEILEERGFEGFQSLLRIINKPLYEDLFKGDYKNYMQQINSLKQYKEDTFMDSTLMEEKKTNLSNKAITLTELSPVELKEAQDFWGTGFEENEYIWLTTEYIDYTVRYGIEESKTMEDTIAEICLTRLDIRNRRRDNKDVDKQLTSLDKLMTAAGIKPIQENMAGSSDQDTYGMWIKKLENERPISDPSPEWADVDGIRKYIVTFFLHPWARLFNKHKESPYYMEAMEEIEKNTVRSRHDEKDDE